MNKHKAFTLIEMMFVLQIIIVLGYFTFPKQNLSIIPNNLIIHQIYLTIENARLDAIQQQTYQSLQFDQHYIYHNQKERLFNQSLLFQQSYFIRFNPNGHIQQASTVHFSIGKKEYNLIFNLGQGAYYIEEI